MYETWILAASETTGLGDFAPWANLTATVVMVLIFVWILTKRDPLERDVNRREIAASRAEFLTELAAERKSREIMADRFMVMLTENRERSHEQRMEDRRVYLESTQTLLRESLAAMKEMKHGDA